MSEGNSTEKYNLWSESMLLGFLTLFGYVIAFTYEFAYSSSYFGIPHHFIDIRLVNIFVALFIIAIFCYSVRNAFDFLETIGVIGDTAIGRFRGIHSFVVFFCSPFLYVRIQDDGHSALYIFIGYLVLVVAFEVISTIVHGKGETSWKGKRKKLEEVWSIEKKEVKSNVVTSRLFGRLFSLGEHMPRNILASSILLCVVSYSLGYISAYSKTKFYTLSSEPNQVVITQYGNTVFTLAVERSTNTFASEIRLVTIDDLSTNNVSLKYEKIGKLKRPDILSTNN